MGVHPVAKRRRTQRADDPRDLLPVVHQHQGGNPANAEALREVGRRIGVDLDQLQAAGALLGDLLDDGRHHPARSAPGRPEIDQDRQRALLNDRRVIGLAAFRQPGQGCAADAAMRHSAGRRPDPILPSAVGTADQRRLVRHQLRNWSR